MSSSPFSLTVTGRTLDELYSNAANVANAYFGRSPQTVQVSVSDTGALTAAIETTNGYTITPAVPAGPGQTDDEGAPDASAPEFDSAGTPWDKRIHASTKTRKEDGTWTKRRGTSDVFYATVMAELAGKSAGQQPAAAPAAPVTASPAAPVGIVDSGPVVIPQAAVVPAPVMAAPAAAIPAVPPAPVVAAPVEQAPATPVAADPAAQPVAAAEQLPGMGFDVFMPKVAQAMQAGKFDQPTLDGWVKNPAPNGWGLASIGQLAADRMKTQQFYDWLKGSDLID